MVPLGRRGFLGRVGAGVAGVVGLSRTSRATPADGAFDPTRHAFGFLNWSTSDFTYPEHRHVEVDPKAVETQIRREWRDEFADLFGVTLSGMSQTLTEVISRQMAVSVNQLSASNGHCYGMIFAAQRYFESPQDLPAGFDTAAEVTHPDVPLDAEDSPIGDLVDHYQATQLLDLYAWVGRRRMLRPKRIDYDAEIAALVAVVDEFGSAGLTLVDTELRVSHQVLVYDYSETVDGTILAVYDPNFTAAQYRKKRRTLLVRPNESPSVLGYANYDAFVFNRWDRAIRTAADVDAPTRDDSRDDFGNLLSRLVRVTVDSPVVSLALVAPDGTPIGRNTADYIDRDRTDVSATRYRYDAPAGDYRIAVVGTARTDYDLGVEVAGLDSDVLERVESESLSGGEVHEYVLSVPEDGTPTLSRVGGGLVTALRKLDSTSVAVGVASGAALTYLAQSR